MRRLRVELARVRDSIALLTRASQVLGSSRDYEETLRHVMDLALPALGDFGFFDVVEGETVRRIARAWQDPRRQELLDGTRWTRSDREDLILCGLSTNQVGYHPKIDDAWLERAAAGPEHLAVMRALAFGSMVTVPLRHQQRLLGALTLFFARPGRHHERQDVDLAEELAHGAAAAIENARLFAQARAAIRRRDEFLALAGHELRTPLSALSLRLQQLVRMTRAGTFDRAEPEARVEALAGVERQVRRMQRLVTQVLDVSAMDRERFEIRRAPCDLAALARGVVDELQEDAAARGSALELRTDEAIVGRWDPVRVEQVMTNLLANALRYGGGKPIRMGVERTPVGARIEVTDHGRGIPAGEQARIFDKFERGGASKELGGMGIGLWLCHAIVDAHRGTIAVRSAPGAGATFTAVLPDADPAEWGDAAADSAQM